MIEFWNRLRDRLQREHLSADLKDELHFHKQMLARDQRANGESETDAQHAAHRRLGNATTIQEQARAVWSLGWLDDLAQDLRYGWRALRRSPAFTLTAALTLALGIGANSAIFTVLYRTGMRALPVHEPHQLVHVVFDRGADGVNYNLTYPFFNLLRTENKSFAGVAAHTRLDLALGQSPGALRVSGAAVSSGFFTTIGARIQRGRDFVAEEEVLGGPATVVLSHGLWSRLGARSDIIGSTVTLGGTPFIVAGVTAPEFNGLIAGYREDLWVPMGALDRLGTMGEAMTNIGASWLDVFARLADGTSLTQAQAEAAVLDARAVQAKVRRADGHIQLREGSRGLTHVVGSMKEPLTFLMGAVGLVLMIACVNVANLLLARAGTRHREIAIRLAIGASRWRLIRQLLVESALLSAIGGAAALAVAWWGIRALLSYEVPMVGRLFIDGALDLVTVVFTAAVTMVTAIAFGLVPAFRATRSNVVPSLKGTELHQRGRGLGARGALVVVQVAISLTLATGATLFLRSLQNLRSVDVGFTADNVLLASIDLEQAGYDRARGAPVFLQVLDRLRTIPGVEIASAAQIITPSPGGSHWDGVRIEGYTPPAGQTSEFDVNKVAPGYFETLGVRIVSGRSFDNTHVRGTPLVAVVNESFVRLYSASRNPIGQHLYVGTPPNEQAIEIIGVAHDGKYRELRESSQPNVYFPLLQQGALALTLVVRTTNAPHSYVNMVRREIATVDPMIPVFDIRTLADHVATATSQDRMIATLSSAFGVLALMLAALGLFGVMAYRVTKETRAIGIRMALGARPHDVVAMIVGRGAVLVLAGLLVGVAGVWGLGRFAGSMLYGVAPTDLVSLGIAALLLTAAGLAAAWLPARRAARVDPLIALRSE